MSKNAAFDIELVRRYETRGPRYTSYPTAVQFNDSFDEADYLAQAQNSNAGPYPRALSLYIHIPFCSTVCFYCACNKVVTKNRGHAVSYLARLSKEIQLLGRAYGADRRVEQLHWGGGTPNFLNDGQMYDLMLALGDHFNLCDDDAAEYSIEIDPREVDEETMARMRALGFNRVSLGVQDFDPSVQKAVNRIQSEQQTLAVLDAARRHGFKSVSMDLIYGLPLQSTRSFDTTLAKVIDAGPDRLSLFNYAHLPEQFKTQRQIDDAELPSAAEKLEILAHAVSRLGDAGYRYIGMDHFARPEDELSRAQHAGTLQRNFQGYSTHAGCDLVGMGVSAISSIGDSYSQNTRILKEYYARLDAGRLPVSRGIVLTRDDLLRREIIMQLICSFALDIQVVEHKWGIVFAERFAAELETLHAMQDDGLLSVDETSIRVSATGRFLVRNICMVFDSYLQRRTEPGRFSLAI
jgi:oxygen-independent coproporphyrinogen-3 oxidase